MAVKKIVVGLADMGRNSSASPLPTVRVPWRATRPPTPNSEITLWFKGYLEMNDAKKLLHKGICDFLRRFL